MKRRLQLFCVCYIAILFSNQAQTTSYPNPTGCLNDLPIRDNSCPEDATVGAPDEFTIEVTNAPGNSLGTDVFLKEVRILIKHTWIGDLDINLISPSGQSVLLMADLGGGDDDLGDVNIPDCGGYVTFALGSCTPIESDFPPFLNGPYAPMGDLLDFNDSQTNPNGDWILQICDDVIEDGGFLKYFELVFEPLQCLPLQNPQIVNVDTTTAVIDWLPVENCGPIVIEYGPPGFTPGTGASAGEGQIVNVNGCAPFLLSNLAPDTDYEVYLRNFCTSNNTYALNSCPLFFQTGCLPPPATLVTNFDNQSLCGNTCGTSCTINDIWTNDQSNDDFDWIVATGETPTFGTGPLTDVSGSGNYIYLEASGSANCPTGTKAFLISNCIQFDKQGTDTCHFSFNYHMFGFGVGALSLEVSEDGGFQWQEIWKKNGDQGDQWHKEYLSLAAFEDGSNLQFRFVGEKGSGSKGDIAIDEIIFHGSTDGGNPETKFFVDNDNDGFGDPSDFIFSCSNIIPAGYVDNGLDCDDTNEFINPDAPESPCNGVDENCNGPLDDSQLVPPTAQQDTVCSGEPAELCAIPSAPENFILWYGSSDGNDLLAPPTTCLQPDVPVNNSSIPVEYTFYAAEVGIGCASLQRAEVKVVVNPKPSLIIEEQPAVCPDQLLNLQSVLVLDLNFTGGTLVFADSFPITTTNQIDDPIVDPALTDQFYAQVTTDNGCTDSISFNVDLIDGPALSFFPAQNLGLCGESTELVSVSANGGNGPYEYLWSNGVQTDSVRITAPEGSSEVLSLQVRVTDQDGCFSVDSITYSNTNGLIGVQRSVEAVSACGGNDGQIQLRPLSGTAPFRYKWSGTGGISGDSLVNNEIFTLDSLAQAAYDITITDASSSSCEFIVRSVLVNGPSAVLDAPEITPVSCEGALDGEICITPQLGGTPDFLWSNGATTSCIENLAGGTYSVTVTEGECSTIIENLEVTEPEPLKVIYENTAPTCFDNPDGRIDVSVFGGTPGYSYQWSNGITDQDQENILPGFYTLTVIDGNACEFEEIIPLNAPEPIQLFRDSLRNISCFGEEDGFIRISTVGGVGPYTYEWSNGTQSPVAAQLGRGNYTISVTDFNGCLETLDFVITEPDALEVSVADMIQPICVGDATGSIAINAAGGTYPYTYEWNINEADSLLENIGVGQYQVIVRDRRQCTADTLVIDLEASSVLEVLAQVDPPSCLGKSDGSIQLQPNGRVPFSYTWSTGSTDNQINNLEEGIYEVTVQDGDGCVFDSTFTVLPPEVFSAENEIRNPSCFGETDGLISINVNGDFQMPLIYQWNDGSEDRNRVGVGPGNYQLTITDNNNCLFITDTITVESPEALNAAVLETGRISCKGDATGFIELFTSGGTAPYSYEWNNNEETESIFNITAGVYSVQIRDSNDCLFEQTVQLNEPEALVASIDITLGEVCSGDDRNILDADVRGGVAPYRYLWNNDSISETIENVAPGDYLVSITDANQCLEVSPSVKIKDVSVKLGLDTFYVSNISCNGEFDGTMTAKVFGGRAPYQFHFSNNHRVTTNLDSVICEGLPIDMDYQVTITDRNGCIVESQTEIINEPPPLTAIVNNVEEVKCFNGSDGAIFVTAVGGTPPYNYTWFDENNVQLNTTEDLQGVPEGLYSLSLLDDNGCDALIENIEVEENVAPIILVDSLVLIKNITCKGESNGSLEILVAGGNPPYRYNWDSGAETRIVRNLPAGSYEVTVTDDNNCEEVFTGFALSEPATNLEPDLLLRDVSCFGENSGSATILVTGGQAPYQLSWLSGSTVFQVDKDTVENIAAGSYTVIVEDQNNCIKEVDFDIGQPELLVVDIQTVANAGMENIDQLTAIVEGGVPNYQYLWNTGEALPTIAFSGVQDYSIQVTDANNCVAFDTIFLTSVVDQTLLNKASLYPNPASITSQLKMELKTPLSLELSIYSTSGQLIFADRRDRNTIQLFELPVEEWAEGGYFIQVRNGNRLLYSNILIIK